jgi:hypothetical protein
VVVKKRFVGVVRRGDAPLARGIRDPVGELAQTAKGAGLELDDLHSSPSYAWNCNNKSQMCYK